MKLGSFQGANTLIITQSSHGTNQGGCPFDFGWKPDGNGKVDKRLYAPCDGSVFTEVATADGDNYFNFSSPDNGEGKNFYIQFVHDKSYGKKFYKKGEPLGESIKDHHHVAIFFNGWHWIFDYMDRNTNLYFWTYPRRDNKWAKWSSYPTDLQLPEKIVPIETCEVKLASANTQISTLTTQLATSNTKVVELTTELGKYKLHKGDLYEKS